MPRGYHVEGELRQVSADGMRMVKRLVTLYAHVDDEGVVPLIQAALACVVASENAAQQAYAAPVRRVPLPIASAVEQLTRLGAFGDAEVEVDG